MLVKINCFFIKKWLETKMYVRIVKEEFSVRVNSFFFLKGV